MMQTRMLGEPTDFARTPECTQSQKMV